MQQNTETFQQVGGAHIQDCRQSQLIENQQEGQVNDECSVNTATPMCL